MDLLLIASDLILAAVDLHFVARRLAAARGQIVSESVQALFQIRDSAPLRSNLARLVLQQVLELQLLRIDAGRFLAGGGQGLLQFLRLLSAGSNVRLQGLQLPLQVGDLLAVPRTPLLQFTVGLC